MRAPSKVALYHGVAMFDRFEPTELSGEAARHPLSPAIHAACPSM
jgi:hypothetical protein